MSNGRPLRQTLHQIHQTLRVQRRTGVSTTVRRGRGRAEGSNSNRRRNTFRRFVRWLTRCMKWWSQGWRSIALRDVPRQVFMPFVLELLREVRQHAHECFCRMLCFVLFFSLLRLWLLAVQDRIWQSDPIVLVLLPVVEKSLQLKAIEIV